MAGIFSFDPVMRVTGHLTVSDFLDCMFVSARSICTIRLSYSVDHWTLLELERSDRLVPLHIA